MRADCPPHQLPHARCSSNTMRRVVFHPKEPIVGSASSDKTIYLGELAQ